MTMFYCEWCQETSHTLDEKEGHFLCENCGNEIFESQEELDDYLFLSDKPVIESFDKPKGFKDGT